MPGSAIAERELVNGIGTNGLLLGQLLCGYFADRSSYFRR